MFIEFSDPMMKSTKNLKLVVYTKEIYSICDSSLLPGNYNN